MSSEYNNLIMYLLVLGVHFTHSLNTLFLQITNGTNSRKSLGARCALVFQPLAMLIFLVCSAATIAKFVIGEAARLRNILKPVPLPTIESFRCLVLSMVNYFISFVFWTSVVGHDMEACFVAYHCKSSLELNTKTTLAWFILVCMVGYPVMTKFNVLLKAQMTGEAKAKISYRKNK